MNCLADADIFARVKVLYDIYCMTVSSDHIVLNTADTRHTVMP